MCAAPERSTFDGEAQQLTTRLASDRPAFLPQRIACRFRSTFSGFCALACDDTYWFFFFALLLYTFSAELLSVTTAPPPGSESFRNMRHGTAPLLSGCNRFRLIKHMRNDTAQVFVPCLRWRVNQRMRLSCLWWLSATERTKSFVSVCMCVCGVAYGYGKR